MKHLENLNEPQKEAVQHGSGPLLMSAGAGSGKTRALTSRLKHLIEAHNVPPQRIVAITFTNKAADEMRERVFGSAKMKLSPGLPLDGAPFIGTFHSFGLRILKQEVALLQRTPNLSIYDNDKSASIVKKILKSFDISKERLSPPQALSAIGKIKNELRDETELIDSEYERDVLIYKVYAEYERQLQENNALDFDDLIQKPVQLFLAHKNVLQKYQDMFDYILVDEYQDINNAQYQLIRLLGHKHKNVNVVGDDQQAIYGFRGANFRNFLNFQRDWPSAKVVKLEQSYRSTKKIIESANALIKNNKTQAKKELWTDNEEGQPITLVQSSSAEEEALWLASEIQSLRRKDPSQSIAILYRTNAQSRSIEQALLSFHISYKIYGGLRFYDRKEIKDIVAALTVAHNEKDTASIERLEKSLGKRRTAAYVLAMKEVQTTSAVELINIFLTSTEYPEYLAQKMQNAHERIENIAELVNFASSFESLGEFLDQVLLLQANDDQTKHPQGQKMSELKLMTVHIAKGLEFDTVFIVGVNDGNMPHQKAYQEMDGVEEERRLMYVAMTRARKKLYISYFSYPSRFLYEIPQENCDVLSADGGSGWLPDEDDMYIE
ncbi:MAG: UvrD-helicase domain-containing protein [Candidatus Paceibacterota bacterium]